MSASEKRKAAQKAAKIHLQYITDFIQLSTFCAAIIVTSPFCTVSLQLSYLVFRLARSGKRCYHKDRNRDESKHPERVSSILKKARLTKDGTQEHWEMTRTAVIRGLITSCVGSFLMVAVIPVSDKTSRKGDAPFRLVVFVDIFADAKSIYPLYADSICLLAQTRYDRNPFSPRRAYRVRSTYRTP